MNEIKNGTSIWDGLPEDWLKTPTHQEESSNDSKPSEGNLASYSFKSDNTKNESYHEKSPVDAKDSDDKKELTDTKKTGINKDYIDKKTRKKELKQKEKEYKKKARENKLNSTEKVRKAYTKEKGENKRDFIIFGAVIGVLIIGLTIFVYLFTSTSNQKIYALIESGNYATAYQSICDRYEAGNNVDDIVFDFIDSCVNNSEYKRAIAALDMLSDDAGTNEDFFDNLISSLISHDKENRAEEVFNFLYSQDENFQSLGDTLLEKYADSLNQK